MSVDNGDFKALVGDGELGDRDDLGSLGDLGDLGDLAEVGEEGLSAPKTSETIFFNANSFAPSSGPSSSEELSLEEEEEEEEDELSPSDSSSDSSNFSEGLIFCKVNISLLLLASSLNSLMLSIAPAISRSC